MVCDKTFILWENRPLSRHASMSRLSLLPSSWGNKKGSPYHCCTMFPYMRLDITMFIMSSTCLHNSGSKHTFTFSLGTDQNKCAILIGFPQRSLKKTGSVMSGMPNTHVRLCVGWIMRVYIGSPCIFHTMLACCIEGKNTPNSFRGRGE